MINGAINVQSNSASNVIWNTSKLQMMVRTLLSHVNTMSLTQVSKIVPKCNLLRIMITKI